MTQIAKDAIIYTYAANNSTDLFKDQSLEINCLGGEMVYTEDLKSSDCNGHAGSSPARGTIN